MMLAPALSVVTWDMVTILVTAGASWLLLFGLVGFSLGIGVGGRRGSAIAGGAAEGVPRAAAATPGGVPTHGSQAAEG